ncbi:glutathione-regulated potassium-efflux system protein KefC [Propionivibrio sp.]|uniref:glutathione-regulated potassium-efflux system protein KefC n=1 Tax=Propionivibrio sp. TaxID=2212460 RepID=UPI0026261C79|nr:glutathione-regulated potassium-efflux system protein KefC [Propionivibrio sp.]
MILRDALIYLAAAVICVPIAWRFKLGAVLGYLIAGITIGPWGFNLVSDVDSIMHFSELGVVLMLFVIGLELEPKRLIEMRKSVFGGGALQLGLTGIALALAAAALGLEWKAALIVGLALALSSTAIAIATMTERNFLPTPTGQSSFAVLLLQDIAAIPLLAIIPLMSEMASSGTGASPAEPAWSSAAKAFGAIAAVILIGLYCTRPVLRLVARTNLREVFTAFALLLVIGIAQIMSLVGLSMGLGTFLAGVLLASSEYRHALETDIEPFKGLLLGLFFISVGMAIDFGLLVNQPVKVAMLVAGFLTLKLATLWLTARIIGVTARQRWLFAILLSQGGEFGFVVFGAAQTAGILSREWADLLNMTVALSMTSTPLLLLLHDWWIARIECAGKEQADEINAKNTRVIIAGFGRFGQIVGRLLFANGIDAVVLDHDPDQIELLRKFGYKVFYGDASRLDLLHAAGAAQATLIVNAIDDVEDSLLLADIVRENFPGLKIIARARNVMHYVELRSRGVDIIERETFEAALKAGRYSLEILGIDRFRARDMANIFRRHNVRDLEARVSDFKDEASRVSAAKAGRDELAALFARDREQFEAGHSSEEWR